MVLRFIILICCINLYLVASYAQTLSDELVFEERVFDFGEIKEENGLVSHEFEFKNVWGIERSGFFNGREKWAKGFENQRV